MDIQTLCLMERKKPIQSVSTRWNSTYYMLEYFINYKRAIKEFIRRNPNSINIENFTENEWILIQSLVNF